jgi:DNA processing protein
MEHSIFYNIALTLVPGVGDILGKKLISLCGSAEAVFREPRRHLKKLPRIGNLLSKAVGNMEILAKAEEEIKFMDRYGISALFFLDPSYPQRLRQCIDSPVMLYYKGSAGLNPEKMVGIVGTRNATEYGKAVVRRLVGDLARQNILVVSGLAYGIDSCSHRAALDYGLETVGVLGHGLDRIYPLANKSLAEKMLEQGGLISDFLHGTKPDRENFPRRNRIIAGLSDALVVVEAACKGGALITADIANSYNREVFAVPGRIGDIYSEGCHNLIRTNRAALIQHALDIEYMMGWKKERERPRMEQRKIFLEMSPEEEKIVGLMNEKGSLGIDEISKQCEIPMNKVSSALLNLEFEGIVKCLPGKIYNLL